MGWYFGVVDFDAPEGTLQNAVVEVEGLISSSGIAYTPMYQIIDTVIRVTIASGSYTNDGLNQLLFKITQSKGFQDSTGTFVAGTQTTVPYGQNPTLTIDQSQVGTVKFNFGIPEGRNGVNGKSAFQIAQDLGWTGSDFAWLQSLKGADGKSAYQLAVANGYSGTEAQWIASLKGAKGDTGVTGMNAYQIAQVQGFTGTLNDWMASLKGAKGDKGDKGSDGTNGKSAYELAVAAGFVGDEAAYLASLKGAKGDKGETGASVGGSRFDEIAGGVFWWIRPRYEITTNKIMNYDVQPTVYYDEYKLKENFVVEETLYTDHGVYLPPKYNMIPSRNRGQMMKVIPTKVQPFGTESVGKVGDRLMGQTDLIHTYGFQGVYYVELDRNLVGANGINESNLDQIEVEVFPTQAYGYETLHDPTMLMLAGTGRAEGLVLPVYLGAVADPFFNRVYLLFRPTTYAQRRNGTSVPDVFQWDGIANGNGEPKGWDIKDPDVKFWSTNVAQGFKFVAKMRKR